MEEAEQVKEAKPERLKAFKDLCRQLLAEGIKPTATEFAKRGWPYVLVAADRHYARNRRPIAHPGTGTTFSSGKYAKARREVFIEAGWTYKPYPGVRFPESTGVWVPPNK